MIYYSTLSKSSQVPGNGWAQIVAFAGYYELFVYKYSGTPGAPCHGGLRFVLLEC
jgi:hypothetical protein